MEYRTRTRQLASIPAAIRTARHGTLAVVVENINAEGAFVRGVTLPNALGEVVALMLRLSDRPGRPETLRALVVREQPEGVALMFLEEWPRVHELLDRVAAHCMGPAQPVVTHPPDTTLAHRP